MIKIKESEDLTGQKFGRLIVLEKDLNPTYKSNHDYWLCKCNCGSDIIKSFRQDHLIRGESTSCGCLTREKKRKYNTYDLTGEYGIGWTTNTNKEFYFDLEDYDKIKNCCWSRDKYGYISSGGENYKSKDIRQHRLIKDVLNKPDIIIDHINCNTYDNRKKNLRYATQQTNAINKGANKNNKLGIKGVYKHDEKYYPYICKNGKQIHLGTFKNLEDAIYVRKQKEIELFGDFAYKGVEVPNE